MFTGEPLDAVSDMFACEPLTGRHVRRVGDPNFEAITSEHAHHHRKLRRSTWSEMG